MSDKSIEQQPIALGQTGISDSNRALVYSDMQKLSIAQTRDQQQPAPPDHIDFDVAPSPYPVEPPPTEESTRRGQNDDRQPQPEGQGPSERDEWQPEQARDGQYVPEAVDDALWKRLEQFGIPRDTFDRVLAEINKHGQDPEQVLPELMRRNRVLAIGERHTSPNEQRDLGAKMIEELKKAGATHLAIEAPVSIQPALDEYMRTGRLDPAILPILLRDKDYLNILEEARKAGIKIVAVDANRPVNRGNDDRIDRGPRVNRDEVMAKNIDRILSENKDNKVIFWVGSAHLDRAPKDSQSQWRSAADLIRENHSIATVRDVLDEDRLLGIWPLPDATVGLSRPVAVRTADTPNLRQLPQSKFSPPGETMGVWDYVFIYPPRPRQR